MEKDNLDIEFDNLKPYQQKKIEELVDKFSVINDIDVGEIASVGMICRKCGFEHFVKNGRTRGVQRYKCRACKSTQSHDANTPLYNLKLKDKWADFVFIMLDKDRCHTCESIAKDLDINYKTAHAWRHKLASSLNKSNNIELSSETELDEVYMPFTVKGVIGKEKYEEYYGPGDKNNVISELREQEIQMENDSYQSIYMCIHNREGDFDFIPIKIQKKGIVSEEDIKRIMSEIELSNKTIITDSEPSLKAFLNKIPGVNHLIFKSSDIKKGILKEKSIHNNNINNTMMLFKDWMKGFKGVSTKYLQNYMKWFRFNRLFELSKIREMLNFSLSDKQAYPRFKMLFKDYFAFVGL